MELEVNVNGQSRNFKQIPATFMEFEDQLVRAFNLVPLKDCEIKFMDFENDLISITNNEEFTHMLSYFRRNRAEQIHVFVKEKPHSISNVSPNIKSEENLREFGAIAFDSSLNLDSTENQRNSTKEKPQKARFFNQYKEDDLKIPALTLKTKESSVQIDSKIPYSEIPCMKCNGLGEKAGGARCRKCDGTGKMKNTKKLKKIEYLVDKKLQALLSELESLKYKQAFLSENKPNENIFPSQSFQREGSFKFSLPANLNSVEPSSSSLIIHKGYICDCCKAKPIIGFRYHCTVCQDFDYCEKCEAKHPHEHPFIKYRKVLPEENRSSAIYSVNQSQNLNNFIESSCKENKEGPRDSFKAQAVDIPSKIPANPGKTYRFSLKIKNNGACKWPDNTELKCINGLHKETAEGIPSLNCGEEYTVNIVLQAPKNPGIYASSWRLSYRVRNDVKFFGPKMDFNIDVEDIADPLEEIYAEKAKELKKMVEENGGGELNLACYVETVKKLAKYSIQEIYKAWVDNKTSKK